MISAFSNVIGMLISIIRITLINVPKYDKIAPKRNGII